MKNLLLLMLAATLIFLSCDKDDDCDNPGDLNSIIVGEWEVVGWDAEVEFQADGDFIDTDEILVDNFNNVNMTYVVDSPTHIRILVFPAEYMVPVASFDCDEIDLSVAGFDFELTRK